MDAAKLYKFVADNINIYLHWNRLRTDPTPAAIDSTADFFIEIVQCTIQYTIPWVCLSIWANSNFTPEYRDAVRITRILRRVYIFIYSIEDWAVYVKAYNRKDCIISKSLRRGFRRWIAEAVDQNIYGIWRVAK